MASSPKKDDRDEAPHEKHQQAAIDRIMATGADVDEDDDVGTDGPFSYQPPGSEGSPRSNPHRHTTHPHQSKSLYSNYWTRCLCLWRCS